ncbi:hypothetical protein C1J03_05635 [Sulfitobacter sp. SK012]|nr:hypothetical protein C1J03_05635 [Sulfitobacter sp. SK012]
MFAAAQRGKAGTEHAESQNFRCAPCKLAPAARDGNLAFSPQISRSFSKLQAVPKRGFDRILITSRFYANVGSRSKPLLTPERFHKSKA